MSEYPLTEKWKQRALDAEKRIAELEASYAECMRQYDHQQERACNAERRLETYKLATKTMLAHIWSWER
jgi:chromosome segregation ATPase